MSLSMDLSLSYLSILVAMSDVEKNGPSSPQFGPHEETNWFTRPSKEKKSTFSDPKVKLKMSTKHFALIMDDLRWTLRTNRMKMGDETVESPLLLYANKAMEKVFQPKCVLY